MEIKDKAFLRGFIEIELHDKNGKLKEYRKLKNTITEAGMAELINLAGNVSTPHAFTYLALGVGTTPATDADQSLESEITDTGLARAAATVSRDTTVFTNDTLKLVKAWTATGVKAVSEIGAFIASPAGIMLGRQVFSVINTENTDILTMTYKFIQAAA